MFIKKPKHKSKPKRKKPIFVIFGSILFASIVICTCATTQYIIDVTYYNQRYVEPFLADIKADVHHIHLIRERLTQYLTIGESTREDVIDFIEEHLPDTAGICFESVEMCQYFLERLNPLCNYHALDIRFLFREGTLNEIQTIPWICLK